MDAKCKKLLNALLNSKKEWTTAHEIASVTNNSIRSVKSYIGELNSLEKSLVESSAKGYKIDKTKAKYLLFVSKSPLPYTPADRIRIIMKKLLVNASIDLGDLCENELFVSLETIKKDLSVARKYFGEFDITINTAGFIVSLMGSEQGKRKLLSNLLYEEFSESTLDLTALKKNFPDYDVKYIYDVIFESCKNHCFFVNEYSVLTLVLDIVISVDRLKNNFVLPDIPVTTDFHAPESALALDIIHKIEKYFSVTYNNIELNEIIIIICSNLIKTDFETITMENIENYVDPVCISLIQPLKNQLANYDFIDVDNLKFMTRFVLHINNLLLRLKNDYVRKNPLTENIKASCPMLFECGIALSDIINQKTGYQVSEHEAAYIAMHIGSLLIGHQSMKDKVICTLLFPPYYDYGEKLVARLTGFFGPSLVIKNIITYIEELKTLDASVDLVISIVHIPDFYTMESVQVSPFLTKQDFDTVLESVERIKLKKKKARLYEELRQISNPAIFFMDMPFNNEDEVIRYMSAIMTENGYVEKTFCGEVLERERSYSTAYGNISVPHSMRLNAKKTGMAVMINKKPIPWGKHEVNVVLLFSIQRETRSLFYDIFDNLIVLLLEAANVTKIMSCKTHEEFIKNIINCL